MQTSRVIVSRRFYLELAPYQGKLTQISVTPIWTAVYHDNIQVYITILAEKYRAVVY